VAFYREGMAKTWVLRTDTKGTGAQMVPLESVQKRASSVEPVFVPRQPATPAAREPAKPKANHRFRIVDVMSRQTLVDDASTRATIAALRDVRSTVDVDLYVWQEDDDRWRLLSLPEQRTLFELARAPALD
jgi:hypothetical protein